MDNLYQRVKKYIIDREMIRPGEAVVAGISGGADSLCLFEILRELAEELPFSLYAAHVHHGLRDSAQGDLVFVEEICRQAGVPCITVRRDAAAAASAWGTGVEEAGRRIRYEVFDRACRSIEEETGTACRIAVAHHREDQAETVLFHLCRGTDLRGARGMLPVNGRIIRPLLMESREAIEAFLREKGLPWREDETNRDTSYTRNYLRAEILPRLAEGVNPAAAERIAQFAGVCAEAERYLSAMTEEGLRRCAVAGNTGAEDAPVALSIPALLRENPFLRGRILYRCLASRAGTRRDLRAVHIDALRGLSEGEGDGRLSMPGGVTACRRGRLLFLEKEGEESWLRFFGEVYPFSEAAYECRLHVFDGNMDSIPRNQYTKWFDYDKIGMFPVFRTRQPGDRMTILTPGSQRGTASRKLARVMLDAGIPADLRDRIVLPFCGKEALWVPGIRMGDGFRITPETARILEIRVL